MLKIDSGDFATGASLAAVRARSLAEQVADSIVDGIAAGILIPGQRVLELELARQLQVSRVPVREALRSLGAQGILESAPHRGTHIADFDQVSVERISEVRIALEKIAVRHAMNTYASSPDQLGKLDLIIEAMKRCVENQDWVGVNKADVDFHREICAASRNEIVITLWEALARHVLIIFGREILSKAARSRIVDQHRRLRRLLKTGDPKQLEAEVGRHIMGLRRLRSGKRGPVQESSMRRSRSVQTDIP